MNPGQRILPLLLPVCLYTINCKWFLFWNSINKCTAKSSASIYRSPVGSLLWSHWARKLTLSFSSLNWHLGPPTASPDSLTARQWVTAWKGSLSIRGFDCVAQSAPVPETLLVISNSISLFQMNALFFPSTWWFRILFPFSTVGMDFWSFVSSCFYFWPREYQKKGGGRNASS